MTEQDLDILAAKIASKLSVIPRWMTLGQATRYSNIGKARLVALVKKGQIRGFQDQSLKTKPWRFDMKSIDAHMEMKSEQQFTDEDANKIALDILATVRL